MPCALLASLGRSFRPDNDSRWSDIADNHRRGDRGLNEAGLGNRRNTVIRSRKGRLVSGRALFFPLRAVGLS